MPSRRDFLAAGLGLGLSLESGRLRETDAQPPSAPGVVTPSRFRPVITHGVASGEVHNKRAVVWSRCDRPARIVVDVDTHEDFHAPRTKIGPAAMEFTDYTAKIVLDGLAEGEPHFYRVRFESLERPGIFSEPVTGKFRLLANGANDSRPTRDIQFAWSGDTAGQGWGIDPAHGGMLTYDSIRKLEPDFFIHSGDMIYADNPILPEVKLENGAVWKNLTTPETSKVAETLDEFRGRYRYNLLDEHLRRFLAEVPQLVQWDDHETTNNWYPGEILDDPRYTQVQSCSVLAARGRQAFLEYQPIVTPSRDPERIYRKVSYGPLLDVFVLDLRSYRGPNGPNRETQPSASTALMGPEQTEWLARSVQNSRAVWKVIASDMPIGLIVPDGPKTFENVANGNGPALGREIELARVLKQWKTAKTRNIVWLTADVHYAAAHHYDPARAKFTDFDPFWEFVAGPLHAGNFGPNPLDDTFGPEVRYQVYPPNAKVQTNRPPSDNLQFFGIVRINAQDRSLSVAFHDRVGKNLRVIRLEPDPAPKSQ